ncbi:MAG: hypothetical protein ACTSRS_14120 [Candidatus Helarchaeota archaeon]
MTHSLHRMGTEAALKSDFVLLAMRAAGIHDKTTEEKERACSKLLTIGQIFDTHHPVNIMMERLRRFSPAITATYDDPQKVISVLQELKRRDFGLSVVVSGLITEIQKIAKEVGLKPHTVHLSLGIFGKKDQLPSEKILEITTQCGHHCVSPQSISHYLSLIKKGKLTIDEAAQQLAKPCICGIVNPSRVTKILQELVADNPS